MNLNETPQEVLEQRKMELLDRLCEVLNLHPEEKETEAAKHEIEQIFNLVGLNFYNAGQRESRTCNHVYEDYFQTIMKEWIA